MDNTSLCVVTCQLGSSCPSYLVVITQEMKNGVMLKCLPRQVEEVGEYSQLHTLHAVAVGQTTLVATAWDKMGRKITSAPRKIEVRMHSSEICSLLAAVESLCSKRFRGNKNSAPTIAFWQRSPLFCQPFHSEGRTAALTRKLCTRLSPDPLRHAPVITEHQQPLYSM